MFASYTLTPPLLYYRYIDDIFTTVFKSKQDANIYIDVLNSLRSYIKFEYTIGDSINFLDTTISKSNRFKHYALLDTTLYQKPMNKYLYLPPFSFHRRSVFSSYITSEIKRYCILCSNIHDFHDNKYKLYTR